MTDDSWFSEAPLVIWETKRQQQCISLGAILSERNGFPVNVLAPGRPPEAMRDWLGSWWGVHSKESATAQVSWLFECGHSRVADAVAHACHGRTQEEAQQVVAGMCNEEPFCQFPLEELMEFVQNYSGCLPPLRELGYVPERENRFEAPSPRAFDIGRAVIVTRVAFGAKFLSRREAKKLVLHAGVLASREFSSWSEFARSYLYGRAVWGGALEKDFHNYHLIAQQLLRDESSPWHTYGWPRPGKR